MGGWWMQDLWNMPNGQFLLFAWCVWVIGSITLHELGHGVAAIRQGDDTPIHTGHMTWNPIVHMGWFSLIAFAIIGIAWGAMPVNPSNFRSRYGDAIVSFAGPLVNLALAGACIVLAGLWEAFGGGVPDPFRGNLAEFLQLGAMLNIVLFVFNLMPVPPLDGSHILGNFVPSYRRLWETEYGAVIALVIMLVAFRSVGGVLFDVGDVIADTGVGLIAGAIKAVVP